MTHTPGAIRAARYISAGSNFDRDNLEDIIDHETHAAELLAFVERVAEGNFLTGFNKDERFLHAQHEAFALLKKVRQE